VSNVVILGDGLLGSELSTQTKWDIISRKKDGFGITDPSTFSLLLETYDGMAQKAKYDTIINCIANTDTYSTDRQAHWDVNYKGVAELVEFCNKWKVKLVHISTDYVYANSTAVPTEEDVPVHQETYYAYTKLLADGYIELRSGDYLLIRATHKPTPFPYEKAWINQVGNFDYVNIIAQMISQLIQSNASGTFNVGTQLKSMFTLAQQTNKEVLPTKKANNLVPGDTIMNLDKLNKHLSK